MKRLPIFLVVVSLTLGCAASGLRDNQLRPGEHKINCSGEMGDWEDCFLEADDICGEGGYIVLKRSDDGGQGSRRERGWRDSSTVIRRMKIRCMP